ncbi:penicillin acylase family protein [Microbacterium elymi]|uniref:Penicillin acylase family protein n=1 Tax=Microbacterium elymi TaxID=2909587 RepID=A0ABY5NN74_9MICO|nr:penicillin acylase family protein [Microbacterium elymi]UUT36622.1 penicillin acylase family protein [Microbacterium elymi]
MTVQRDDRGIPTLTAADPHDLFFAQGYVHAQDRFWEMDFRRHVTSGRLSELFGKSQLGTDRFLRTLGWRAVAEKEVDLLSDDAKAYYQAYADGVNAYLAAHDGAAVSLEYAVLGLQNPDYTIEKWTIADSLAWLKAMAWDLRSNLVEETSRALLAADGYSAAQIDELYPKYPFDQNPVIVPTLTTDAPKAKAPTTSVAPASVTWSHVDSVIEAASALVGGAGEGIGSNSWVVSGDLTASGKPLLANDPHLGASDAQRLASDRPEVRHGVGEVPVRRRRIRLLGRARGDHRPQRDDRLGLHEPHHRRHRPVPGEDPGREVLARRHARAADDHAREDQGGRREGCRSRDPLDEQRSDHLERERRRRDDREGSAHRHRRHRHRPDRCARRRDGGGPEVDRADARHHRRGDLHSGHGAGLRRVPRGGAAVRRPGAEPDLRRHRRQHRLPGAGQAAACAARATGRCRSRDGIRRTTGRASSRSRSSPSRTTPIRATS